MNAHKIIPLVAAAAMTVTLASCGNEAQGVAAICVDPATNMRVDDSLCSPNYPVHTFIPWYITAGYTIPAYGWPVAYGYAHQPSHTVIIQTPSSGGVIPKRSTRGTRQTVQPTSAATQAPPPKKTSVWNRQKTTAPTTKPAAQTQSQQKTQWKTYPQSKPAQGRPPNYPQSRPQTQSRTTTRYR